MKGFTLIELLVVVVIIGILTTIALPQYELVVEKSRASEAMINAKAITDAMQRHIQEFPGDTPADCTKIADVQLKGGSWGATCAAGPNVSTTSTCENSDGKVFSTKNFCYDISGNSVTVTRMDGSTPLYVISYSKPTENTSAVASATCGDDYAPVCKMFTNL